MVKQIIICDIDGCLNFYPDTFLHWVDLRFGIHKKDIDSLKSSLAEKDYEKLKHTYRTCGIKRKLAVKKGAIDVLKEMKKSGKKIWLLTTRPVFEPVKKDTKYWLRKNKIMYDKLIFKEKKEKKEFIKKLKEKICFIIDDNPKIAIYSVKQLKVPVFLFGDEQNKKRMPPLVTYVKSWHDIKIAFPKYIEKNYKNKAREQTYG